MNSCRLTDHLSSLTRQHDEYLLGTTVHRFISIIQYRFSSLSRPMLWWYFIYYRWWKKRPVRASSWQFNHVGPIYILLFASHAATHHLFWTPLLSKRELEVTSNHLWPHHDILYYYIWYTQTNRPPSRVNDAIDGPWNLDWLHLLTHTRHKHKKAFSKYDSQNSNSNQSRVLQHTMTLKTAQSHCPPQVPTNKRHY